MSSRRAIQATFGVGLCAVIYWAYSYTGPYRWLAEFSLRAFGSYSPKLAFMSTLLMFLLPSAVLRRFVNARSPAAAADYRRLVAEQNALTTRIQSGLILATLGAVLLFVGGRDLLAAHAGTTLVRTSCASIEAGTRPASTWLNIQGTTRPDAAVATTESYHNHRYVPLVSNSWSKAQPLAVVLRFDDDREDDMSAASFEGGVSTEDLPGMVRTTYEAEGVQAGDALVLVVGNLPGKHLTRSRFLSGAGLLAVAVGAFLIWRKWR